MDARALFPRGWHPQRYDRYPWAADLPNLDTASRTAVGGVRYYYIDFGISTFHQTRVTGLDGQERAPELSATEEYDPYKLDVYILGRSYFDYIMKVSCPICRETKIPTPSSSTPVRAVQGQNSSGL